MKITAIRNATYIQKRNSNSVQANQNNNCSTKNGATMSYFDIPFWGYRSHRVKQSRWAQRVHTGKEIKPNYNFRAQMLTQASRETEQTVLELGKGIFSMIESVDDVIETSFTYAKRYQTTGQNEITDKNGNLIRQIFSDDDGRVRGINIYEEDKLSRSIEFFDDGSLMIDDKEANALVFANNYGTIQRIEVFEDDSRNKLRALIGMQPSQMRAIMRTEGADGQTRVDVFEYSFNKSRDGYEVKYFQNVRGNDYKRPVACDKAMYMTDKGTDNNESLTPLVYFENLEKSMTQEGWYKSKKALYYTMNGVMHNTSSKNIDIRGVEPISMNEDVKFTVDDSFPLSEHVESKVALINHNGNFEPVIVE